MQIIIDVKYIGTIEKDEIELILKNLEKETKKQINSVSSAVVQNIYSFKV